MVDPTGRILVEIRDFPTVAGLTDRVRGAEPLGRIGTDPGDARGPGEYVRFVVLVRLGTSRGAPGGGSTAKRLPVQEVRYAARCYGLDARDAAGLAGAVSDAIHNLGPRITAGGVAIWLTQDDGGEGAAKDPGTDQPYETVIISAIAADRLLV